MDQLTDEQLLEEFHPISVLAGTFKQLRSTRFDEGAQSQLHHRRRKVGKVYGGTCESDDSGIEGAANLPNPGANSPLWDNS